MNAVLLLGLGALILLGGKSRGRSRSSSGEGPRPGPYYPPDDPYVPPSNGGDTPDDPYVPPSNGGDTPDDPYVPPSGNGSQVDRLRAAFKSNGITSFTPEEFLTLRKWGRLADMPTQYEGNLVRIAMFAQELRDRMGIPLAIKNGYRSKEYNSFVNGAPNSSHLRGAAIDVEPVSIYGTPENDLKLAVESAKLWLTYPQELAGFAYYGGGRVHLDVFHQGGVGRRTWADRTDGIVAQAKSDLGM